MTIEAKYDIGRQIIVAIDGGLDFSKIVEIYARAQPDKTTITYITKMQQTKVVKTVNGERKVRAEHEVFILEEQAAELLDGFNELRRARPDAKPELLLATLSSSRKKASSP